MENKKESSTSRLKYLFLGMLSGMVLATKNLSVRNYTNLSYDKAKLIVENGLTKLNKNEKFINLREIVVMKALTWYDKMVKK